MPPLHIARMKSLPRTPVPGQNSGTRCHDLLHQRLTGFRTEPSPTRRAHRFRVLTALGVQAKQSWLAVRRDDEKGSTSTGTSLVSRSCKALIIVFFRLHLVGQGAHPELVRAEFWATSWLSPRGWPDSFSFLPAHGRITDGCPADVKSASPRLNDGETQAVRLLKLRADVMPRARQTDLAGNSAKCGLGQVLQDGTTRAAQGHPLLACIRSRSGR